MIAPAATRGFSTVQLAAAACVAMAALALIPRAMELREETGPKETTRKLADALSSASLHNAAARAASAASGSRYAHPDACSPSRLAALLDDGKFPPEHSAEPSSGAHATCALGPGSVSCAILGPARSAPRAKSIAIIQCAP